MGKFKKALDRKVEEIIKPANPLPLKYYKPCKEEAHCIAIEERARELLEDADLLSGVIGDYPHESPLQDDIRERWSAYDALIRDVATAKPEELEDMANNLQAHLRKIAMWQAKKDIEDAYTDQNLNND